MENKNQNDPNQLNIELPEDIAEGNYVNLAFIAHSQSEFVMDFIRILPGIAKGKVKSRVVMSPDHAQRFLMALKDNLKKYEETFGTISEIDDSKNNIPMNYNGPIGEA
ncbi:MAG: hypothetical protein RIR51_1986 [Bacteroidota bacterium]|jgi:hypothetical protein